MSGICTAPLAHNTGIVGRRDGVLHSYCSYCGTAYPTRAGWPRVCVECGEDWRDALVRELREETGLIGAADEVQLFDAHSSPHGGTIMVFGVLPAQRAEQLPPSAPTEEATEWLVLTEPIELAFSTHTQVLADFLTEPDRG